MQWNVAPEYVSLIFISILLMYSREYNLIPTLKNRLFRLCIRFVFYEIIISIASIISLEYYAIIPGYLNQGIQTLFFLASPMMAVLLQFYLIAVVLEDDPKIPSYYFAAAIPYFLYALVVITNPFTGFLFRIDAPGGFAAGGGFWLTYAIAMLYILAVLLIVLMNHKRIERPMMPVLLFFPAVTIAMVGIQWIFPTLVLSGSAATSALLIVYLYLQNKQIVLDDLTGLQNRKAFSMMLQFYVKRKRNIDIILISLDDFKAVNDRFGQANGDNFLKVVSRSLKEIVPIKSIYRFSGDEFIILLDEDIKISAADAVDAIRKRFSGQWDFGVLQCALTASIAVVRHPDHADSAGAIITLLEYCIDLSKRTGKGKAIFTDAGTVGRLKRKTQIVDLMRRGLTKDNFEVYYQPIRSVRENRYATAEALLRLSDSEMGAISPAEFVPIAEETGLIIDIGLLVLDRVCRFIRVLEDNHVEIDAISVNLSAIQLNSAGLVENLLETIGRHRIDPRKLRLEITESVFVEKFDYMVDMMRKLSEYGILFYLDDFGTGYSNIANVVELPFEFIKIDKSILYESVLSTKCFSVMNGLARTFADVGMKVVVEGVETPEHRRMAEQIDADYMQGFLFSRPMPAEEAILFLGKTFQMTAALPD
jgi:diguanylate cyclase